MPAAAVSSSCSDFFPFFDFWLQKFFAKLFYQSFISDLDANFLQNIFTQTFYFGFGGKSFFFNFFFNFSQHFLFQTFSH